MSGSQKCVSYPGVGSPYNANPEANRKQICFLCPRLNLGQSNLGQTFYVEYLLNRWTKRDGKKNGLANVGSGVQILASDLL